MTVDQQKTLFVVAGPAGSGKTTVGTYIAERLSIPYLEGDDYHGAANKAMMAKGIPLTDDSRWDWLFTLRTTARLELKTSNAVVISCSALKRRYRDVFREMSYGVASVRVCFVYLRLDEAHLRARVSGRANHYMKESMVTSQLESLEEPGEDELDVITIDVQQDRVAVCDEALHRLQPCITNY